MIFFILIGIMNALTIAENLFLGNSIRWVLPFYDQLDYSDMGYADIYDAIEFYNGNSTYLYNICNTNGNKDVIKFARAIYILKFGNSKFVSLDQLKGPYDNGTNISFDIAFSKVDGKTAVKNIVSTIEGLFNIDRFEKRSEETDKDVAERLIKFLDYVENRQFNVIGIREAIESFFKVNGNLASSALKTISFFTASTAPGLASPSDTADKEFIGQTGSSNLITSISAGIDFLVTLLKGEYNIKDVTFPKDYNKNLFKRLNTIVLSRTLQRVVFEDNPLNSQYVERIDEFMLAFNPEKPFTSIQILGDVIEIQMKLITGLEVKEGVIKKFIDDPEKFLENMGEKTGEDIKKYMTAYLNEGGPFGILAIKLKSIKYRNVLSLRQQLRIVKGQASIQNFIENKDNEQNNPVLNRAIIINLIKTVEPPIISQALYVVDKLIDKEPEEGLKEIFRSDLNSRLEKNFNQDELKNINNALRESNKNIDNALLNIYNDRKLSANNPEYPDFESMDRIAEKNICKRDGNSCSRITVVRPNILEKKCSTEKCSRKYAKKITTKQLEALKIINEKTDCCFQGDYSPLALPSDGWTGNDIIEGAGDGPDSIARAWKLVERKYSGQPRNDKLVQLLKDDIEVTEVTEDNVQESEALYVMYRNMGGTYTSWKNIKSLKPNAYKNLITKLGTTQDISLKVQEFGLQLEFRDYILSKRVGLLSNIEGNTKQDVSEHELDVMDDNTLIFSIDVLSTSDRVSLETINMFQTLKVMFPGDKNILPTENPTPDSNGDIKYYDLYKGSVSMEDAIGMATNNIDQKFVSKSLETKALHKNILTKLKTMVNSLRSYIEKEQPDKNTVNYHGFILKKIGTLSSLTNNIDSGLYTGGNIPEEPESITKFNIDVEPKTIVVSKFGTKQLKNGKFLVRNTRTSLSGKKSSSSKGF